MKTKITGIIIICLVLLFATSSCKKDTTVVNTYCTITGTVIELQTGDPVQNATVTIAPSGKNTYTGSDGHFEFLDLDAKQYDITVQKSGYKTNFKHVTTEAGGTINVSITLEKDQ